MTTIRYAHADIREWEQRPGWYELTLYADHGLPDGQDDPNGEPPVIIIIDWSGLKPLADLLANTYYGDAG